MMQVTGSIDMQFCFSILFFVLATFLVSRAVFSRRTNGGGEDYAAQVERLKREEKGG
jgi:hypothetical protein